MKCLVILMFLTSAVWCKPNGKAVTEQDSSLEPIFSVVQQCVGENTLLCLKERTLKYVESVTSPGSSQLIEGVTIINEGSARSSRSLKSLPTEATAREAEVESRLVDTVTDFLENASVQISLPASGVDQVSRSFEEETGRQKQGGKKKMKQLGPLMEILKTKFTALASLFLGILAFVALKGLLLLKIVVIATLFTAAKSMMSHSHETYEIVQSTPEVHSHHDSHGYGHHDSHGSAWGRLSEDSQDLAYSAYNNKKV